MKRYMNDNYRDDAHQFPYTYNEIIRKLNNGTLWNRREYELGDGVASKLKSYFLHKADTVYEDDDDTFIAYIGLGKSNRISITDYYLYTE